MIACGDCVDHPGALRERARERPVLDHVHQEDRHVAQPPEREHLLVGEPAGGADRTVLVEHGERRGEQGGKVGFGDDRVHEATYTAASHGGYVRRMRSCSRRKRGSPRRASSEGSTLR